MKKLLVFYAVLSIAIGLGLPVMASAQSNAAGSQSIEGQTATHLSDGRILLAGGINDGKLSADVAVYDPASGKKSTLGIKLVYPRAHHSATVLPDGRIFIFGGVGPDRVVLSSAELVDIAARNLSVVEQPGLLARSHASTTLLTNGKLLLVGGVSSDGSVLGQAELWDPYGNQVRFVGRSNALERSNMKARLLANGNVLYIGGLSADNTPKNGGLLFRTDSERFEELSVGQIDKILADLEEKSDLAITATIPPPATTDFLPGGIVTVRFSRPVDHASVNADTVVLVGPFGPVKGTVVASQDGMLAFFTPAADLFPATHYTLFVKGVADADGRRVAFDPMGFSTSTLAPGVGSRGETPSGQKGNLTSLGSETEDAQSPPFTVTNPQTIAHLSPPKMLDAADDEIFTPGPQHEKGRWRTGRNTPRAIELRRNLTLTKRGPNSYESERRSARPSVIADRMAKAQAVQSPAVQGHVYRLNDKPLGNVLIRIGNLSTYTDSTGSFQLTGVSPGRHELLVDGGKAGGAGRQYANFIIGINVDAKGNAEVPPVYLPRIRQTDWIPISSPVQVDTVITHPNVPGMEIHVPKGAVLRDHGGKLVTRIALVPVPLDRMPFPFPENAPVYVSVQPAGMIVQGLTPGASQGVRVLYPNLTHEPPGAIADFWRYDPMEKGWYVYGQGRASGDGKQIVPDAGVALYDSVGFMYTTPNPPPPPEAPPCPDGTCCGAPSGGDPVDLASGLFIHQVEHASLNDVLPVNIVSTYRPGDPVSRAFGFGNSHRYAMYLREVTGTPTRYEQFDLIFANGAAIRYYRTAGNTYTNVVAEPRDIPPCDFYKSIFAYVDGQYVVTTKKGMKYTFSLYGRLENIRDRVGNTIEVASSSGQILRLTTQNGRYIDFSYDSSNRITKITDLAGREWTYTYNAAGLLEKITFPDASSESYNYDAAGRMLTVVNRRGNTMVTNEYDANGRVIKQTLADGGIFRFAYTLDANGQATQTDVTDPRGFIRRVTFQSTSRLPLSETYAFGTPIAKNYRYERPNADGQIAAETDALGRRTEYVYDASGNTTRITRLAGTAQAVSENFTYEPLYNQLTSQTDALGKTTNFTYDMQGNLVQVTDPLGNKTKLTYNSAGQLASVTDPLNQSSQFSYDLGDLASITDPLGRVTQRFTDTLGRLIAQTDALGNRTFYAYDSLDRITQVTDALGKITYFAYDPLGNLLTLTDANGGVTQHVYDAKNRLTTRTDPLLSSETYQYDGSDNLIQYTDRKGQVTNHTYDALNRHSTAAYADGSSLSHSYDAGDRLLQATDAQTGSISRVYDPLDRVTAETSPKGTVNYSYDAAGRRTAMSVSGQTATSYSYDAAGRLTQIAQGGAIVGFSYDAASRRSAMTLANGITASYSYDAANQLTGISYSKPDGSLIGNLTYSYNAIGNRIGVSGSLAQVSLPSEIATTSYDAANRLTTWDGAALSYDANGNLISDGLRTYSWDAKNRLTSISGAVTASFEYDALGRRTAKSVNGVETGFLYDGLNPVQELSGTTPKANLLTGLNVDEYLRRSDATGTRDILTDALGSVIALTDAQANSKTRYRYEPYGKTMVLGEASGNAFQYTGRENDGTGLYYYRARYYSPEMARFISEDPIGFAGGMNLYAYVGGDPVNYLDPTGLFTASCGKISDLKKILDLFKKTPPKKTIPDNRAKKVFGDRDGHLPDTPENRRLLEEVAGDPKAVLGNDKFGNEWSARTLPDGTQIWTQTRNGEVINGGINSVPRTFNPETGLSLPVRPGGNK